MGQNLALLAYVITELSHAPIAIKTHEIAFSNQKIV